MNRNYIHDIKPSSRTQKRREAFDREHELRMKKMGLVKEPREDRVYGEPSYRGGDSSGGRGVWYVAALAILILIFSLTYVFAGATVYVTPRQGTVELSGPLTAEKSSKTGLNFQMLTIDDEASATVASNGEQHVEKKATGTVRLFNNNPTTQKLLIDTRLTSPNGLIYKTKVATVIPGQKIISGKTTPGSVDVAIYADEAGESYNIAKDADLKILGFKGGPKYATVYGKTLTEISGGFKGTTSNVSDEDLQTQTENLKASLSKTLLEKAKAELPESFVMYDKISMTSFDEPVVTPTDDGKSADIKIHGTMHAVIFKESDLTKALVASVVDEADQGRVNVSNIRELHMELDTGSAIADPAAMQSVRVNIDDKINVIWQIDDNALTSALVGIKKRNFESEMLKFKNIDKAELSLKPFWKGVLPMKPSAIKIVNTLEIPPK